MVISQSASLQSEVDSLLTVLDNPLPDTTKVDLFSKLHEAFLPEDTSQALSFIHQAITLSEAIGDKKRLSRKTNLQKYL
jgi:hypothetical protein